MTDIPTSESTRSRGRCPRCGQPLVLGQCTFCGWKPQAAPAPPPPAGAYAAPSATGAPPPPTTGAPPPRPTGAMPPPTGAPPPGAAARAEAARAPRIKQPGETQQQMLVVLMCIVAVLVIAVGFLVVQLSSVNSKVSEAKDESTNVGNRLGSIEGQMRVLQDDDHALHDQLDALAAADPAVVAGRVQPSVWTIATSESLGSGWVANSDGTTSNFVTNYHVVADAWESGDKTVDVFQDSNGTHLTGTIEQVVPDRDLALVNVPGGLPALKQSTDTARAGQSVLVIGSPLGLGGSVSTGSVSAVRDIESQSYIQINAPISPGNSGGPVVNGAGEVIGVTVAKIEEEGAEGLGFAIPVNQVCVAFQVC